MNNKCESVQWSRLPVYCLIFFLMLLAQSQFVTCSNWWPTSWHILNHRAPKQRSFQIDPGTYTFVKDGEPFQYISGSMHYFRIPVGYWNDRLAKAKAAGLDAIQIYVPWNYHQPEESIFDFEGDRDLEQFLKLAAANDLLVIARVGPYICAEWAFGGLPPWLFRKNSDMLIRSSSPDYLSAVTSWFDVLLPKIRPFLYENGGPIIMVQLENEYGSYTTCDAQYLSALYNTARKHLGSEIILFTTDGASGSLLKCGSSDPRYLATIDFGPTILPPNLSFRSVEEFRPNQPLVNSEFYVGWFDYWGSQHSRVGTKLSVDSLIRLMNYSKRVNVNMYMFHGGTSFGLWAGKSNNNPTTTSYDYDAPISEAGDITHKYEELRNAIFKFRGIQPPPLPENNSRVAYGKILMNKSGHMLLGKRDGRATVTPMNMEAFGQYEGFALYHSPLPCAGDREIQINFTRFADLAHIFTSNENLENLNYHTTIGSEPYEMQSVTIRLVNPTEQNTLAILIENTGYVNFGSGMRNDVKGLMGPVSANGNVLNQWTMVRIPDPTSLSDTAINQSTDQMNWPTVGSIFTGNFCIDDESNLHDTFLQPDSFSRGLLSVNGFLLGRYNSRLGPQLRLYVPRQILQLGVNTLRLTELDDVQQSENNQYSVTSTKDQAWMKIRFDRQLIDENETI